MASTWATSGIIDQRIIALNTLLAEEKQHSEPRRRFWWHWHNLNEHKDGTTKGSGLRCGRCWWHFVNGTVGLEWSFGKLKCHLGFDINDYDLTFALSIPLVSLYLSIESRNWLASIQPQEMSKYTDPPRRLPVRRECRIAVHDGTIWFTPWGDGDFSSVDPWWKNGIFWNFNPLDWRHIRHSVRRGDGTWEPYIGSWERDKPADHREVLTFPYRYVLKNGEVQERTAIVHVGQMEWRPRCLKWTSLFASIRTSIDITFSDEVGERSGSWKGGCTGCSYELRSNETPERCLRRMEQERIFD